MAEAVLTANSAVESPEGCWPPLGGFTRLEAVEVKLDGASVAQSTSNNYLNVGFIDSPGDVGAVTRVDVLVVCHGISADSTLNVDFKIDGESKGIYGLAMTGEVQDVSLNLAGWNGPWTKEQIDGAEVELELDAGGKQSAIGVDYVALDIDYDVAAGGPTSIFHSAILRPATFGARDR